jgi:aspartate carbamoyltransferase catalytic subunit
VAVLGPGPLIPDDRHDDIIGFKSFDEVFAWEPEIIYLLRIQTERQKDQFFPSLHEYHRIYGVTDERLEQISKKGIYIMHPGPVNRGVELVDGVMHYERCLINQQVENGIAARMAVLFWLQPGTLR